MLDISESVWYNINKLKLKGCDEDGREYELFQRVGGCCEPIASFPSTYHFRAGVPKGFYAQVSVSRKLLR